ncbi:expressed unknown protein [Seminavis robusta]|uniref:Uncharacterized protein n=1 Tax=Seminavis robusta TaxID=568900 RepID=A0A9N8HJD4_9STRA|nr:expressed unknown protein [Seminavis robusta]|eukprot:Sro654_g182050.1 n/a (370) ;mRNA; f:20399-21508
MKLGIVSVLAWLAASMPAAALVATTENNDEMIPSSLASGKDYDGPPGPLSNTQVQKTVICPGTSPQNLYEGHIQFGGRTRFVVKNVASDPVVVAFVDRSNGMEYSAANGDITPARMDPNSFLAPGMTKVFAVNEGHVFHVRDAKTNELLAQHRAGLIPIENKFQQEIGHCPIKDGKKQTFDDGSYRVMRKFPQWRPALVEKYSEEIYVDAGFKNTVKSSTGQTCPVNFYFVAKNAGKSKRRKPNYWERLTMHLGGNNKAKGTDGELWDASTKYERTYVGHEFVARLAHDDSVVVDHLSIGPVKIQDCGKKKQRNTVQVASHATAIIVPIGRSNGLDESVVNQTVADVLANPTMNTTESRRGLYFKMYTE